MEELTIEEYKKHCGEWQVTYTDAKQVYEALRERLGKTKEEFLAISGPAEMLIHLLSAYNDLEMGVAADDTKELRRWKDRARDACVSFLRHEDATAEELAAAINGGSWVVGQKLINGIHMTEEDKEYLAEILSE